MVSSDAQHGKVDLSWEVVKVGLSPGDLRTMSCTSVGLTGLAGSLLAFDVTSDKLIRASLSKPLHRWVSLNLLYVYLPSHKSLTTLILCVLCIMKLIDKQLNELKMLTMTTRTAYKTMVQHSLVSQPQWIPQLPLLSILARGGSGELRPLYMPSTGIPLELEYELRAWQQ